MYWYDIQNDTTIPEKISKQKENKKNSIQIFISQENTLCQKSFDRFVDAIDYARYNQRRKKVYLKILLQIILLPIYKMVMLI
ncbi:hypothetical protein [Chryseobacterium indoltheticum]|uniref:hypothetical protein n=1 Tax=Chryseobacterium indoltheticum TaxID=254 RepID=UPI003F496A46